MLLTEGLSRVLCEVLLAVPEGLSEVLLVIPEGLSEVLCEVLLAVPEGLLMVKLREPPVM